MQKGSEVMTREELLIRILESKVEPVAEYRLECSTEHCGRSLDSVKDEIAFPTPRRMAERAAQDGWSFANKAGAICPYCAKKSERSPE